MTAGGNTPPLVGMCDGCGKRWGALNERSEHKCEVCASKDAQYDAAYDNLCFLFMEAIKAWDVTWGDQYRSFLVDEMAYHAGPDTASAFLAQQEKS